MSEQIKPLLIKIVKEPKSWKAQLQALDEFSLEVNASFRLSVSREGLRPGYVFLTAWPWAEVPNV